MSDPRDVRDLREQQEIHANYLNEALTSAAQGDSQRAESALKDAEIVTSDIAITVDKITGDA